MRPYLIEGLDCSGKKAVAPLVAQLLARDGVRPKVVIGPIIGGPFGRLIAFLANTRQPVQPGGTVDIARRAVYVLEPLVDRLAELGSASKRVIKISSHYRAWARAKITNDTLMAEAYRRLSPLHVRFSGASLLYSEFSVRIQRHNSDLLGGRTVKDRDRRFLGPDRRAFEAWHIVLRELLVEYLPSVVELDSTHASPDSLARSIANHIQTR